MAYSRSMSSASSDSSSSLVDTLSLFYKSRQMLNRLHGNCQKYCSEVSEIYKKRCDSEEELGLLTDRDNQRIEQLMEKEPIIIVAGMRNSGKTSLLNELLGSDKLPSKMICNTGRRTKILYSEEEFVRLRGPNGEIRSTAPFSKKTLQELAVVEQDKRSDENEVKAVVEVGLNNQLLRDGLMLVDLPGLDENQAMDDVVFEALDGQLQILVYVIDGCDGVRTTDEKYLLELKERMSFVDQDIIFVCNKAEFDQEAHDIDRNSDDEDDDDTNTTEAPLNDRTVAQRKSTRARARLAALHLVRQTSTIHEVSCKRLKAARKDGHTNNFVDNFNRLRQSITNEYEICIQKQIYSSIKNIAAVQIKLYTLIQDERNSLKRMRGQAREAVSEATSKHKIMKQEASNLRAKVVEWLNSYTDTSQIEKAAKALTAGSRRDEFYQSLAQLTVCTITETIVLPTLARMWETMVMKAGDHITIPIGENVKLIYFYLGGFILEEEKDSISELITRDKVQLFEKTVEALAGYMVPRSLMNRPTERGGRLDDAWKASTAVDIFKKMNNMEEMAKIIVSALKAKLDSEHEAFINGLNSIVALKALKDILSNSNEMCETLLSNDSDFAQDCYLTKALLTTLREGMLSSNVEIAHGSSSVIYFVSDQVVGKKFTSTDILMKEICIRHSFAFFGQPVPGLVQLRDVKFDDEWEPVYLMKRYRCRLDDALHEGFIQSDHSLHQRLYALLDVCKTLDSLMDKGLKLRQVYPRYFLVEDRKDKLIIAYNLLKNAPHEMKESIAEQLAKLLALLFHGLYDDSINEQSAKKDYMNLLKMDTTLNHQIRQDAERMLHKYLFKLEDQTMTMFIQDLEKLMETAKTAPRVNECHTS